MFSTTACYHNCYILVLVCVCLVTFVLNKHAAFRKIDLFSSFLSTLASVHALPNNSISADNILWFSQVPGPLHLSLGLDLLLVVGFLSLVLMIIELFFMEDGMVNITAELVASTSLTSKQWYGNYASYHIKSHMKKDNNNY